MSLGKGGESGLEDVGKLVDSRRESNSEKNPEKKKKGGGSRSPGSVAL